MRVENSIFCSEEIRNAFLEVCVNVDGAVETWWTTTSEAVLPESLGCLFFDVFVAGETCEVEAGEVCDCFARPDEFGFGTCWTRNDGEGGEVETLSFGEGLF